MDFDKLEGDSQALQQGSHGDRLLPEKEREKR